MFVRNKILEKLRKGYSARPEYSSRPDEEQTSSYSSYARKARAARKPPAARASAPKPAGASSSASSKTTYKIYGRRGDAPVHTRYKAKIYKGPYNSKFSPNTWANVALGTDGRLSVNDPKSGHTQHWNAESISRDQYEQLMLEFINELALMQAV